MALSVNWDRQERYLEIVRNRVGSSLLLWLVRGISLWGCFLRRVRRRRLWLGLTCGPWVERVRIVRLGRAKAVGTVNGDTVVGACWATSGIFGCSWAWLSKQRSSRVMIDGQVAHILLASPVPVRQRHRGCCLDVRKSGDSNAGASLLL